MTKQVFILFKCLSRWHRVARDAMLVTATSTLCLVSSAMDAANKPGEAPQAALAPVVINAQAVNRDQKPYRDLQKAMDVFERNRAKAPLAKMRFVVLPWRDPAAMQDLKLVLRSSTIKRPVALAADGSFTLERDDQALAEDAMLVSNRQSGSLAWRADIRTPGLPPNTRRLGDLRLECKVDLDGTGAGLATAIKLPAFWAVAAVTDPCLVRGFTYGGFADQALFGITLVSGERRKVLSSDYIPGTYARGGPSNLMDWAENLRDRAYMLPLWDSDWPDETLVLSEPLDEPIVVSAKVQP